MKKTNLPKDWIVAHSTSFPDRVYYFNVVTNTSSWTHPHSGPNYQNEQSTVMSRAVNKRKKVSEVMSSPRMEPKTPEYDCDNRPKLRAKRQLLRQNSVDANGDDCDGNKSKDTPQMRELKQKILERQAKGNAKKRSKIIKSPEIKDQSRCDGKISSHETEIENETQMTPQMKTQYAKLQSRKSLGALKAKQRSIINLTPCSEKPLKKSLRGMRARSMGESLVTSEVIDGSPPPSSSSSLSSPLRSTSDNGRRTSTCPTKTPAKKSRSCAINERINSMRTVEAPPGVASKRIIVGNEQTSTERDLDGHNLSIDLALTPSLLSTTDETPSKKACPERINGSHREISISTEFCAANTVKENNTSLHKSTSIEQSPPNIYKNAEERLRALRNRLSNEPQVYTKKRRSGLAQESDPVHELSLNTTDIFQEEMEWEPIEDERIFHEIQSVRAQLNFSDVKDIPMNDIADNILSLSEPDGRTNDRRSLYIVVDTNVFLTNLNIVEEARDAIFKCYGRPLIVIPWTTIRELDFIKDDKTNSRPESLKAKARRAVRFLNQHFTAKHPRVLGQTPGDVAMNKCKFSIECPDDEILQTCLQIRESNNTVVLLSYDRNLCNKAMIHDIMALGRDDCLEKVDLITEFDCKNESLLAANLKVTSEDSREILSPLAKELAIAEELYEEIKTVLTTFLTIIVAKEMENLFGDSWERFTIIKPPWTAIAVLKCAIKHWIAAVSDSFIRRAESILKELCDTISKMELNRRLSDIDNIIHLCFDLVQCLRVDKHPNTVMKFTAAIDELKRKYREALNEMQEYYLNNEIGRSMSEEEEESKAMTAFTFIDHIYENARDSCGMAAQSMGMTPSFSYNTNNNLINIKDMNNRRPEVAANINRLLLVLSTALEDTQQLNANHRYVIALFNALETLYSSLPLDIHGTFSEKVSPLDVYFCLKRKEGLCKFGLGQFQQLSTHFCKMATFKFT